MGRPHTAAIRIPTEGNVSGREQPFRRILDRQAREQVTPSGDKRLHIPCRKVQRGGGILYLGGTGKIAGRTDDDTIGDTKPAKSSIALKFHLLYKSSIG